jgi:hypothetical protein
LGDRAQRSPEGEPVEATSLDRPGGLQDAAGAVGRNGEGELIVKNRA